MSDADQASLLIKRAPGGLESLDDKDRAAVEKSRDVQLDRAEDLLRGILLYDRLAPPEKVAAK